MPAPVSGLLHPNFRLRLNLVEVWFSVIEKQTIHRGAFGSVKVNNAKVRAFITGWNDRCHPFVRTKQPDEILKKATAHSPQKGATRTVQVELYSYSCRLYDHAGPL
ncbi:hypothetical protein GCM10010522_20110 [Kribbella solani]|uniref:Uncharacterized protein n=1 Tax=Kribbella solani TaxID=236067 RepID=A0A841DUZ7_9ACTN|nr:hypothetical protein [Kribbella solani]